MDYRKPYEDKITAKALGRRKKNTSGKTRQFNRYSKFKKLLDCQNSYLNKMLVLTVLGYKKISLECTHVKI
jgi:hypothetical protein